MVLLCHRSSHEELANGVYLLNLLVFHSNVASFPLSLLFLFFLLLLKILKTSEKPGDLNHHHGTSSLNYYFRMLLISHILLLFPRLILHNFVCVCVSLIVFLCLPLIGLIFFTQNLKRTHQQHSRSSPSNVMNNYDYI